MSVYETILKRRTVRKFKQQKIDRSILEKLIDAARLAPSAMNLQPVKYVIVDDAEKAARVFESVKWAGYIAPEGNPAPDERPVAFIVVLEDTELRRNGFDLDIGAAVQNILLVAAEQGIGTCWMGAIDRDAIRLTLAIPGRYTINTVIALGYAAECPIAEDEHGCIEYYKDKQGVLHVPKRKLEDIILKI